MTHSFFDRLAALSPQGGCRVSLAAGVALSLLVASPWGVGGANAQDPSAPAAPSDSARAPRADRVQRTTVSRGPLLDAPVNRAEYFLGAGDQVTVSLIGDLNRVYDLSISPEGTLLIPSVAVVSVRGLTLDAAERRVEREVLRLFRNTEVRLNLERPREFKVFLLGAVPDPGLREVTSVTRASEVLPGLNRRNILLRRGNRDTVRIDLARFRQVGDLGSNPTLREGDVLVVPTEDLRLFVYGEARFPGPYEFRPEDTLAGLLEIANGGSTFPARAADSVRVARFVTPTRQQTIVLSRADAVGAAGRAFRLQPSDAVYIPSLANFQVQQVATVSGEVARPGTYPIVSGRTTVRELIAMAGGFTPEASLVSATLQRQQTPNAAAGLAQLRNIPSDLLTEDEKRVLSAARGGGPGTVVIDFQRLFAEGASVYDQPVRSGDVLTLPTRRDELTVLGAVQRPGLVQFTPGARVDQVLALAGGPAARANRSETVILKAGTGARLSARDVSALDPGDTIIVPYEARRDWAAMLQTVSGIVATVTGLILSFNVVF